KAVDDLEHSIHASGRTSGERPERADALDGDRRADGIGGWRFQIAVGELRSSFIDRSGGEAQGVTDRDGLIDVVQPRRGARRAQGTGATSVLGRDLVQTVANAELIDAAQRMVDLREEIGTVNRV